MHLTENGLTLGEFLESSNHINATFTDYGDAQQAGRCSSAVIIFIHHPAILSQSP